MLTLCEPFGDLIRGIERTYGRFQRASTLPKGTGEVPMAAIDMPARGARLRHGKPVGKLKELSPPPVMTGSSVGSQHAQTGE